MLEIKEAAGRAATAATTKLQSRDYPPQLQMSRLTAKNPASAALGALLLYLVARPLPPEESRLGWGLAEKWARQIVDARQLRRGVA